MAKYQNATPAEPLRLRDLTAPIKKRGANFNLAGNGDEDGASAGIVDMADYNLWKANFGAPGSGGASAAVPKPNTMLLVALTAFGLLRIRRR